MSRLSLLVMGVSQDLDFETGDMTNFALLRLPDGKTFRAAVEDEVAQAIIGAATSGNGASEQSMQPMQESYDEQLPIRARAEMHASVGEDGQTIMEFGGLESEETPLSEEPLTKLPPEMVMKGRGVLSGLLDDMGNLRSIPGGGVDPGEVVISDGEDGTDSI